MASCRALRRSGAAARSSSTLPYSRSVLFMARTLDRSTDNSAERRRRAPPPGDRGGALLRDQPVGVARSLGGELLTGNDQVGVADVLLVLLEQRLPPTGDLGSGRDLRQRVTRDDRVVAQR